METRRKKQTQRQKHLVIMTSGGQDVGRSIPNNYFKGPSLIDLRGILHVK